ncbi:hypothetical protein B0T11DRAFT_347260 [Plectosphaerella cucumerina]|uniref:Uncharacterized protein n=1 Tax=Plectosphaerella cucumerina TaxID=40658 RepID=A0A8K0TRC9_9PEZI|nr:hypothetical protein B0T11DRAFT_347260 [Plectosphaerella cucumerina]
MTPRRALLLPATRTPPCRLVPPTWPLPPLSAPWSRPSSRPFKRQDDEREMNLFFSRARHYANWTRRRRSDGASRRRDTFFFTYTPLPSPTNSTMRTSTSHLFCTSHRILRCDILPFSPGARLALVTRRGIWTPLHLRSVSPAEDPPAWHGIALYPSASLVVDFSLPPRAPLPAQVSPPNLPVESSSSFPGLGPGTMAACVLLMDGGDGGQVNASETPRGANL